MFKRIGVICHSPSIQMSAQYDALADIEGFSFHLLFRRREQGNAAWKPVLPRRVSHEFLPEPIARCIPGKLRPFVNGNIRPILDRHDFDALILHGFYDSTAVWQARRWCKNRGRPYLLRCDTNVDKELASSRRRLVRKIIAAPAICRAAGLLYIGTQNRRFYELCGARPEQLFPAPWEVDYFDLESQAATARASREQLRRQMGVADSVVIVTAARLIPEKGFATLLRAVTRLAREGIRAELFIAGEGPYSSHLRKAIERDRAPLRLLGNLDRKALIEALCWSDVFVLASFEDAWGLVINEAALCGLPLVVSNAVGAAADLVRDGENGLVFTAGDHEQLYRHLRTLALDPAQRASMGERSRSILEQWRTRYPARAGYENALRHAFKLGRNDGNRAQ